MNATNETPVESPETPVETSETPVETPVETSETPVESADPSSDSSSVSSDAISISSLEEPSGNWEMAQSDLETGKRVFASQARESATLSEVSTKAFFRSISLRDGEIEQM